MEHTFHGEQEWEEYGADTHRGQHHRHEILACRLQGCDLWLIALAEVFQVAVDDHDAVVYNHAQHNNQGCQRDNVELDAHQIHDGHRDKRAQRDGDGSNDGRPQRKQHHHDKDDDRHGDEKVAQERADAELHHLGLVGDARDIDVVGQLFCAELIEHAVHLIAILHHIVSRRHLHREQHAGMAVLLDAAGQRVIFPHHARHVGHSHHLSRCGIAVDDGGGNLLLAVLSGLYVDGYLLVGIADASAHGGQSLCLQMAEKRLLANAVGL